MRSARTLFRLNLAIGGVATLVVALAGATVVRSVALDGGSLAAVAEACRYAVTVPSVAAVAAVALGVLGTLGAVVAGRAAVSCGRHLRTYRRTVASLPVLDVLRIGDTPVALLDDPRPQAFCAGYLRPRIYVSAGALEALDGEQLAAVLGHEDHHRARRDPLRILVLQVLADALFFLPVLRHMRERYGALAELAADEAALRSGPGAAALASALLVFGETQHPSVVVGIAPERVDHLLGERPRWELPASLVAGGVVTILALAGAAVVTTMTMGSGVVALPVLLSELCRVAMVVLPIVAGAWFLLAAGSTSLPLLRRSTY